MDKVLIIEDDEIIRENLKEIFINENYKVVTANNGKEGLEIAKSIYPDLILSDILMPELNGFEVFKSLRAYPELSVIPFIFLSAVTDKKNFRYGMGLGADDYILKPFQNLELLDVVKKRIEKSKLIKKTMEELKINLSLSVPHEFFTPLNAVLGFSQFLIDGSKEENGLTNEDILEFSEYIQIAGKKLLRLTRNYVLFTELTINKDDPSHFDILRTEVIHNTKEALSHYARELTQFHKRENDLELEVENAQLMIGITNFKKIIEELMDNAIKFSDPNTKIKVSGFSNGTFYRISIEDEGIGLDKEEIQRLESFIQLGRSKKEQSGMGLGLALVRKLIEIYQGEFYIESKKGKGTKVVIHIPILAKN